MSDKTQRAARIIEGAHATGLTARPHDYDLRVAEALTAVAAAEALERIAATIENILDRGGLP